MELREASNCTHSLCTPFFFFLLFISYTTSRRLDAYIFMAITVCGFYQRFDSPAFESLLPFFFLSLFSLLYAVSSRFIRSNFFFSVSLIQFFSMPVCPGASVDVFCFYYYIFFLCVYSTVYTAPAPYSTAYDTIDRSIHNFVVCVRAHSFFLIFSNRFAFIKAHAVETGGNGGNIFPFARRHFMCMTQTRTRRKTNQK